MHRQISEYFETVLSKFQCGFRLRKMLMKIEFLIQDLKSARFSCQNENFVNTSKILWKNTEAVTRGVL